MLKPAVFFDRDGVLVQPVIRDGIPYAPLCWEDFSFRAGGDEAVRLLRDSGFMIVVVTNQPEVRRGRLDARLLEEFHESLRRWAPVDQILTCCHDDQDECECRKPRPGLILQAARRHQIDLAASYFVGDTSRDLEAARAAGVGFILIDASYNRDLQPAHRVSNLPEAARLILDLKGRNPVLS